jgi:hypothetical protein
MDPSFTHVLTFTAFTTVSSSTNASIISVPFSSMSGAPQLSSFFEMFKPTSYRIIVSYTNWSGTVAFVPYNPSLPYSVPTTSTIDSAALMEVRGAVRVQAGFDNTGVWCTFPFTNTGLQTYNVYSSNQNLGFVAHYNDAPTISSWTIQTTIEINVRFFRRTLFNFTITPTLSKPDKQEEEDFDSRGSITTLKTISGS